MVDKASQIRYNTYINNELGAKHVQTIVYSES